jgi:hypothetical protein
MKIHYFIIVAVILLNFGLFGQVNINSQQNIGFIQFSKKDSLRFSQIPQLKLPNAYKNKSLPAVIDNSELIYFRPLF